MRGRWIIIALLFLVAIIAIKVFTHSDPAGERLQRAKGTAYQLIITRFSQGEGLVCPPFRLDVRFDSHPDLHPRVLFSEQSDDVMLAQTPSAFYIFYNDMILNGFNGTPSDTGDAKPVLCDLNVPICANEMKRLASSGTAMQRVCGRVRG